MALNNILIALTCTVAFPAAVLAQSPVQMMAATASCCATDDGSALAAAVLLPPAAVMPTDACCQTAATPAPAVDHSAHMAVPAAQPAGHATHAMADMSCCDHGARQAGAKQEAGCCQDMKDGACCKDMKDGCGMGCCESMPPKH